LGFKLLRRSGWPVLESGRRRNAEDRHRLAMALRSGSRRALGRASARADDKTRRAIHMAAAPVLCWEKN